MRDLQLENERLTQENTRLRIENSALRPLVSELQTRIWRMEHHHNLQHKPPVTPPDLVHG